MFRIFRHYIPKDIVFLGVAEAAIFLLSAYLGVRLGLFVLDGGATLAMEPLSPRALLFAAVMLIAMSAMGLYERDLRVSTGATLLRIVLSFAIGALLVALLMQVQPELFASAGALAISMAGAFMAVLAARLVFVKLSDAERFRKRILVLGAGQSAQEIANLKRKTDWRGMTLVGFVAIEDAEPAIGPSRLVPMEAGVADLAREHRIDEIVVAMDERRARLPVAALVQCKLLGIKISDTTQFLERTNRKIAIDALRPSDIFFSDGFSKHVFQSRTKRIFDVLVSLVALLPALPIMALTAVAIRLEGHAGEPILYRQTRVGKNGRHFELLKFRSMRVDAEGDGVARWAVANDDRITRTGRIIRRLRIDELPQLFNVLRNEMSFVGPRPERPQFVEDLQEKMPYYALRHQVNPGITGWAQVRYPYGASEKDAKEKLQYDLYYIKNYSVFLDLMILFQTVQVVLWGKGVR
jgi:sugar transferase (PEP-CTERM system associated)